MSSLFLTLAAVNGFIAVALGAFGAHGLKKILSASSLATWETAVHYQMFHVAALLGVGVLLQNVDSNQLRYSGIAFQAGIVLFSGSLYLLALSSVRWLGMVTPLGGLAFLAGWVLLGLAVSRIN